MSAFELQMTIQSKALEVKRDERDDQDHLHDLHVVDGETRKRIESSYV